MNTGRNLLFGVRAFQTALNARLPPLRTTRAWAFAPISVVSLNCYSAIVSLLHNLFDSPVKGATIDAVISLKSLA
jgi:hypothetical protein